MFSIYLAGPIENVDIEYSTLWRGRAMRHSAHILAPGDHMDPLAQREQFVKCVDPTFYDGVTEGLTASEVVIRDTFLLEDSDAVLADGRRPGWGTAMEILRAYQSGKLVVVWGCEKPSLFLEHHTAKFVRTPEEGIDYIVKLLRLM